MIKNIITLCFSACLALCARANMHTSSIFVEVQKGKGVSCAIACLQAEVANAGISVPFGTYELVFGMGFAKPGVSDSATLVVPGDNFIYESATQNVLFVSIRTADTLIYSCIEKIVTRELHEDRPMIAVKNTGTCPCVYEPSGSSVVATNAMMQTASLSSTLLQQQFEQYAKDSMNEVMAIAVEVDTVECQLARAVRNHKYASYLKTVPVNITEKITYARTVGMKKKQIKIWKKILPVVEYALADTIEVSMLARSFLCERDLRKYTLKKISRRTAGCRAVYAITHAAYNGQQIDVVFYTNKKRALYCAELSTFEKMELRE